MNDISTLLAVLVPALGVFGVWMTVLVRQIGKTQTSELTRIEQKVDLLREAQTAEQDHLSKTMDREFLHISEKLDNLGERIDKWFSNHQSF